VNPPWQETAYHVALIAPDRIAALEVHCGLTKITDRQNLPINELWAHTVQQDFNQMKVYAFEPEDLLIHLCYHAAIDHLFKRGIQTHCDVDEAIRKYKNILDWQKLSARAIEWQAQRAVGLTLYLCWQYLHTPIPETALEQLQLRNIDPRIVQEMILQISSAGQNTDTLLTSNLIEMLSEKNLSGMLSVFMSNLLRPNAGIPVTEGTSKSRLFISLRRLIYFRVYFKYLWQIVRKNPDVTIQFKRRQKLQNWLRG